MPAPTTSAARSRSDGNGACRESGAALLLRPRDDDDRTGFRNLVQVRQHFDLVVIRSEDVTLEGIIILGGGETRIRIRGLMPGSGDAAVLIQELQHGLAPTRVMRHAGRVAILHCILIRPALGPIRAHRDERMRRYAAVLRLPRLHVPDGQRVIRVLGNLGMYVEYDELQYHLRRW